MATRSAKGSFWQLDNGKYFVPTVDQVGGWNPEAPMVDANGNLMADERGNLIPMSAPQQPYSVRDAKGAWLAKGDGGTPYTYTGVLPGFGGSTPASISGTLYDSPLTESYVASNIEGGGLDMPGLSIIAPYFGATFGPSLMGDLFPGTGATGSQSTLGNFLETPWGVNPQGGGMNWYDEFLNSIGIDPASVAPFEGSPTNASIWDAINGGTGGTLMPPADPSGMDPNMLENAPPGWNPSRPDPTMLQQVQQLIQQTGLPPSSALKLLGQLGATGLGAYASSQQAGALQGLASKYAEYGAPYRAMLAQSYADPAAYLANNPSIQASVDQGTNALARALSVKGNPAGSGTALTEMQNYATQNLYGQLGNERNRLANFGGLSNFNAAAPTLDAQAVGQQGNLYNALGYGLQQVTNPQQSLTDLVKALQVGGLA